MKKTIIYQNQAQISIETSELKQAQKDFNLLFEELKKTEIPVKPKQFNDLVGLAENPESYISEQLWKQKTEVPKIFGIPVKKAAAISFLDLPDLTPIKEAAKNVIKYINPSANPDIDPMQARHLSSVSSKVLEGLAVKGDAVVIDANSLQTITDRHTLYAETQKEIEIFEAHKHLINCINTMKQIFPLYGATTLSEIVFFEDNESKATVKESLWLNKFTPFVRNQLNNK